MNLGAVAAIVIFLLLVVIVSWHSIRLRWNIEKRRVQERERSARLALELSPAYQAKVTAERQHELASRRLTIEEQEARARIHVMLTRVAPETYIFEQPPAIIPLPSLKPQPAERAIQGATLPFQLPPAYDLIDIFREHPITLDHIFLAKRADGEVIFIKASQLHHAAFSASTGYGKTTLERGIIAQLLSIGHHVVLADLKYADVTEKGEDWRPIASRMFAQPPLEIASGYRLPNIVRKEEQIATLLHWMAYTEMARRLEMRARRDYSYPTLDVFLEELVALTVAYPGITKDILRIISLGRELRLNLFTTAQNMQVSSIGLSGGAREQFTTAWFLGGDEVSAAALLDMQRKELSEFLRGNNIILGQGIGMLRNNYVLPTAGVVRLGYTSNDSVYHLLGRADQFELPMVETIPSRSFSVPRSVPGTPKEGTLEEQGGTPVRNAQERATAPPGTVFQGVPDKEVRDDCNPFFLFSEEQRMAILTAAKQPGMSLRKIRAQAKIGNDSKRFTALKLWLQMNGYKIGDPQKADATADTAEANVCS